MHPIFKTLVRAAMLVALLTSCARADDTDKAGIAICVGINNYFHLGQLQYCANDAIAIKKALEASKNFGHIYLLTEFDESGAPQDRRYEPTSINILRTLKLAASQATPADQLLFFFSGHGVQLDGKHFIVPLDGDESWAISMDEVKEIIGGSRAGSKLLMIDACRSGSGMKGVPGIRGEVRDREVGMLVSCDKDQFSYEDDEAKRGVFSMSLEEAMLGSADSDFDGIITGAEVFDFLNRDMRGSTRAQTPQINALGRSARILKMPEDVVAMRIRPGKLLEDGLALVSEPEKADWGRARELFDRALNHARATDIEKAEAAHMLGKQAFEAGEFFSGHDYWRRSAELGHPESQYALGKLYLDGTVLERDVNEAAKWLGRAAEQRHAAAMVDYGEMLYTGRGVERDYARAARLFRQAAGSNDGRALRYMGLGYYEGRGGLRRNFAEAKRLFERAADNGDAGAEYWLGRMYSLGQEVDRDEAKARELFTRAAEAGDALSQVMLGNMFCAGLGVAQDFSKGAKWYAQAAEKGNGEAMFRLARLYLNGQAGGGSMSEGMRLRSRAIARLKEQSHLGDLGATATLGVAYQEGEGVTRDFAKAAELYGEAAAAGDAVAQFKLGGMHFSGQGVSLDYAEAERLYRQAAMSGNSDAQTVLGSMYFSGVGVDKNVAEAVRWYRMAAEQGSEAAKKLLMAIYYSGKGVRKNVDMAKSFMPGESE